MSKNVKKLLIVVFAVIFVVSGAMLIWRNVQYRSGEETYSDAEELAGLSISDLPEEEEEPEESVSAEVEEIEYYSDACTVALNNIDIESLKETNSDVLGWILLPQTEITYPLLQGEDNEYYLYHTWEKEDSVMGSIFLECQCSPDFSDFNTIVYGHRMKNGSMFATLKYYSDKSYWEEHPKVYIATEDGCRMYEIFAAYEVSVTGDTYRLGFSDDEAKQSFIDFCLEQSVYDTGIVPETTDQILTLSTCTGNGHATRWVVQAVLSEFSPREDA